MGIHDNRVHSEGSALFKPPFKGETRTGAAHLPAPDGFAIEISVARPWDTWRALIRMDDGARFEIYGADYDRLVVAANRFVSGLIDPRLDEATLLLLGAA